MVLKFKLNRKGNTDTGYLVPLETHTNLPFEVKRMFYTYGVPSKSTRGEHAYHNTEQVLICICGSLKIKCFDGRKEEIYVLNNPDESFYIKPHIWRTTFDHSPDAVLLVLSSMEYNEQDYIRDCEEWLEVIKCI